MRTATVVLALLAAGCRLGAPEPVPVRGEQPKVIAVWPWVGEDYDAAHETLLEGFDVALRGRGYHVVPAAVASELMAAGGGGHPAQDPAGMGTVLGCEAVLVLDVREFMAVGTRPLREARWDLQWRLVSTRGAGITWSWSHRSSWFPPQGDFGDPHRPLDAEPDIVPIGGDPRITYRNAAELMASLHRMALSHLPPCSR